LPQTTTLESLSRLILRTPLVAHDLGGVDRGWQPRPRMNSLGKSHHDFTVWRQSAVRCPTV
jgi:hypothetical protein